MDSTISRHLLMASTVWALWLGSGCNYRLILWYIQYNSLARFYSAAIKPQSSAFKCYTHTFSWRNICFSGIPSVTWENTILRSLISYLNLSSGIKWFYWGNKNPCFNIYPLRNYYMPVCKIPRHKEEENVNLQLVRQVRNVSNYKTVT